MSPLHVLTRTLLAMVFLAGPASAATISFAPGSQSVEIGDSVSVDIVVSDLGGEIVSAYDLDIQYDAAILNATGVSFDTGLGDALAFEALESFDVGTAGLVDLAQVSLLGDAALLALQGGDEVRLATLVFEAVGPGTSSLDFLFDAANDIKGAGALILDVTDASGSIRVTTPIPEPRAALLFGLGLFVLHRRIQGSRTPSV